MVLRPIWEHIDRVTKITAKTFEGEITLKLDPYWWVPRDYLKLDPDRGSEEKFLNMIETAHALGIKVVPILEVSLTAPGSYIYEEHPEWILKSIYGGYAVFWPWVKAPRGYIVNKTDPGLIKYVTETVIPHWVKVWGVDGMWLDPPSMKYCDPSVREICEKVVLRACYKRLITVKKAYPALQSRNIENALIKPIGPRRIAYNRWEGNSSVTVIVNAGDQHHIVIVRAKFSGDKIYLEDLLHGDRFHGDPKNLRVDMPPHTAMVLVELSQS